MSTVSNTRDGLKLALELANAGTRVEDVNTIIDMQQQVLQVLAENRQLTVRVSELEDELAMDSQLKRDDYAYYVVEEDGAKTGPVCPGCYKRDRVWSAPPI